MATNDSEVSTRWGAIQPSTRLVIESDKFAGNGLERRAPSALNGMSFDTDTTHYSGQEDAIFSFDI